VPLTPLGRGDRPGELDRVAQRLHPVPAQPGDQPVQDVHRRLGVVERPVVRLVPGTEVGREGAELAVRHLVAGEHPAGQRGGVQHPGVRPGVAVPGTGRLEETDVVRRVVRDQHGAVQELQDTGQHLLDRWRRQQHRLGDPGQHRDERRDRLAGVDQGGQHPQLLAAAHLDRPDLGDPAAVRSAPGRLQVEHDKGGLMQRQRVSRPAVRRRAAGR
jgi:hypothetical protein